MEEATKHRSILVGEVVALLGPAKGKKFLDGTFGGGGHSRALLEAGATVVAVDRDPTVAPLAELVGEEFGQQFRFEAIAYDEVEKLDGPFDGALLDLGLSSDQLESLGRGFSYRHPNDPLDLRFNAAHGQTAAQLLAQTSLPKLVTIFQELAQDRYAKRLAAKIVATRRAKPIRTVGDFVAVVGNADPKVLSPLWQALRISVNDELYHLKEGLRAIDGVLKPGGRLAVISFHSLEDRIVKEFLRSNNYQLLVKKPLVPSEAEIQTNPRSRSAKLRAGIKQ